MYDFLSQSIRKHKRHLKRVNDPHILVQILSTEYVPEVEALALILERIKELDARCLSHVNSHCIRKAIEHGNIEHIKLLLPLHTYHPQNDLFHCIQHQQFEIFDLLLGHTPYNKQESIDKVLADICLDDSPQAISAVDQLVARGANPSAYNLKALGHAIEGKCFHMVEKLIPISDVKNFGQSALVSAVRINNTKIVQQLLDAGAPYNEENSKPLRIAVRRNFCAVVEQLLQWDKAFNSVMEEAFCSFDIDRETLDMLWQRCDIEAVREQSHTYTDEGREIFEKMYSQHQKNILMANVGDGNAVERVRKI